MLKVRKFVSLLLLVGSSLACQPSLMTIEPSSTEPQISSPPLADEEAQAQLVALHQRFEVAAADGLSGEECSALADDYQRLYIREPSLLAARFNVAAVWEACGELERAEAIYVELVERQYPEALNNLGVLAWSRADHERARDLFERAVAIDPTHAIAARNNLATAMHERYTSSKADADFQAAERQLKNVLALDSHNQLAYETLARLYYDRGRLEDASYLVLSDLVVTQAHRVLERDGVQSADLHNLRGLLWMQKEDPARAIRAFQQAVALDPDHADANRNVAMIAIRFRDFATAARALEAVIDAPEVASDVEVWLALGVARRGLTDYDGAEAAYRRALQLAPDDPRAWFNLGVLAQDHRISTADHSDDWTKLANEAAGHFRTFVAKAGQPGWRDQVAEAKDRIAIAEDTLQTMEFMRRLEEYAAEVEAAGPSEAEIEAMLELEDEATSVEAILNAEPPAPPE